MEYQVKTPIWTKKKPTWAKVIISIIALLVMATSTLTSCSASYKVHKKGVHVDTVEMWMKTKTNNATY